MERRMSPYMRQMTLRKPIIGYNRGGTERTTLYSYKDDESTENRNICIEIERDSPSYNHAYGESIWVSKDDVKVIIQELQKLL